MWKLFFDLCYLSSFFVPGKNRRNRFRTITLFDYRNKLNALRKACPEIKFRRVRMIKGGWNIGFIINNKYVFKIRKQFQESYIPKIIHEKRMTDAFRDIVPLRIPKIDVIKSGEYTFYKYEFIPGRNLNTLPMRTIMKYRNVWAQQIAEFIYAMHNANPSEISDLITENGDSWGHNDICNNTIVDTKTMKIVGMIDWEYSGWNYLETEFKNCTRYSSKLRRADMNTLIRNAYNKLK